MSLPTILTATYTGPPRMRSKGPISLAPPLLAAQTAPFQDDKRWKLFVTTSTKVAVWDAQGCSPVFTSGSEGIVAAKRAKDGSVLAIADSQVVMLHRIDDNQDKSYRLKGTQRCRHLQYDHDSRSLFFTDAIHNSVQSYNLKENRVFDAAKPHPSPITSFAISSDSNLILSCSADPPIVQIHNRLMATTISISPRSSSKLVVYCSFHPDRKHIFVLAFGDGIIAAYDYTKVSGGSKAKKDGKIGVGHGGTKEIHTFQHLHDPSIAGSSGVTGVQFIPGYRSRAVTVGEDGRMFLVDFEMRDTLGSWHMGAPATCLTIRPSTTKGNLDSLGGCVIAVGTIHGKCYVYDGNGNKIGEQSVDAEGGKILDVEWVSGEIRLPPNMSKNTSEPTSPLSHAKSFPSIEGQQAAANLRHTVTAENLKFLKTTESSKPKHNTEINLQWTEAKETLSQGYMGLFSPVKRKSKKPEKSVSLVGNKSIDTDKVSDPKLRTSMKEDQRSVISAPLLWNDSAKKDTRRENMGEEGHGQVNKSLDRSQEDIIISPVGQKSPFQGNFFPCLENSARSSDSDSSSFLALHRISSMASDITKTNEKTNDGKLLSQIRSVRAKVEGDKAARGGLSLFAPYMSNKVKTSAMVKSRGMENKISSPPQEKILDSRLQVLDRNRVLERVDGSVDKSENALGTGEAQENDHEEEEEAELPGKEDAIESDVSFDGDIWLVEEKPSKSLKRKNSLHSDDLPCSSFNSVNGERASSRTSSRAGSYKSRKTVSWHGNRDTMDSSNFFNHEVEPPSSPQFDVSSEHSWPSMNVTGIRTGTSFISNTPLAAPSAKKLDGSSNRNTFGASSADEHSLQALQERLSHEGNGRAGLDPALKDALLEMQMMFKAEMQNMQTEIAKKFQTQRNVLEDLKNEMQMVREENGKLRNQLFELSGVREKVKRHQ